MTIIIIIMTRGLGIKRKSGDHPNYWLTEIGQNTEKSPGDLRRLIISNSSARQLINSDVKNSQWIIIIIIIRQVGECDQLGIVQEIENWLKEQMVHAQPRIRPKKWYA